MHAFGCTKGLVQYVSSHASLVLDVFSPPTRPWNDEATHVLDIEGRKVVERT